MKHQTTRTTKRRATALTGVILLASFLGTSSHAAGVAGFIESAPVPGGISVVDLGPVDELAGDSLPSAVWNNRDIAVLEHDDSYVAVVGIPLGTEAGSQSLLVTDSNSGQRSLTFTVEPFGYEEQRLIIENTRKVNPAPMDMERITRENKRLKVVKSSRADTLIASGFDWPLAGIMSSPFGLKRFYNGQPRRPHGGIDIAAAEGELIMAPADGVIIDTGEYFFNGNSVFIEHGLGLQTFYAHMSRIDVAKGQRISQGDILGAVGQTGRVTGPHLHWSVGLNGTWVNPLLLLDTDLPPPVTQ